MQILWFVKDNWVIIYHLIIILVKFAGLPNWACSINTVHCRKPFLEWDNQQEYQTSSTNFKRNTSSTSMHHTNTDTKFFLHGTAIHVAWFHPDGVKADSSSDWKKWSLNNSLIWLIFIHLVNFRIVYQYLWLAMK